MSVQNFKNHGRYIPLWHYIAGSAVFALVGGSIVNLLDAEDDNVYSASLLVLMSFVIAIVYWYSRVFALKAQDRAIRAEENFRHYILSGKPLNNKLRMSQIVALRFASDEEFLALAQKAVTEGLSNKEIKASIINWKADFNRV
jgi:hypothetical protein